MSEYILSCYFPKNEPHLERISQESQFNSTLASKYLTNSTYDSVLTILRICCKEAKYCITLSTGNEPGTIFKTPSPPLMYAGELCLVIGPYGKERILDLSRSLGESIREAIMSVIKDLLTMHLFTC